MRQVRQGSSPKHENTTYKPVDARGHLQTAETIDKRLCIILILTLWRYTNIIIIIIIIIIITTREDQRSFHSYYTQAETAR